MKKAVINKGSSPSSVVGDLRLTELCKIKDFSLCNTTRSAEDSRQRPSGMTSFFNEKAFTLIELLVVVLIIGILSAIALPQYQKAVEKSKATQALIMVKSLMQAMDEYYLANGNYTTSFDDLTVKAPFTGSDKFVASAQDSKSNDEWILQLEDTTGTSGYHTLYMARKNGKYKGAGFTVNFISPEGIVSNQLLCFERKTGANYLFDSSLEEGDYCVKIMNGSSIEENTWTRKYSLP